MSGYEHGKYIKDNSIPDAKNINGYLKDDGSRDLIGPQRLSGLGISYEDLRAPATAIKVPGIASDPVYDTARIGYSFLSNKTEILHLIMQIPHEYLEGSTIYPHIHWQPTSANAGNVRWAMDYKWTNIDAVEDTNFTSLEVIFSSQSTLNKHLVSYFPAITGTGKTISSILSIKIYRTGGSGGDTYPDTALLKEFDIHYKIDSFGSAQEKIKAPAE